MIFSFVPNISIQITTDGVKKGLELLQRVGEGF